MASDKLQAMQGVDLMDEVSNVQGWVLDEVLGFVGAAAETLGEAEELPAVLGDEAFDRFGRLLFGRAVPWRSHA